LAHEITRQPGETVLGGHTSTVVAPGPAVGRTARSVDGRGRCGQMTRPARCARTTAASDFRL